MPGGDRTGPRGEGPQTGRRLGYCAGNDQPGFVVPQPAQGFWFGNRWGRQGRGRGGGWRNYFNTGFGRGRGWRTNDAIGGDQNQDIVSLQEQVEKLQNTLLEIQGRLTEFASENEERK